MKKSRSLVEVWVTGQANPSQDENKNDCYYSSKTSSRGLIIKPSQHSDKNNYYHNFEISNHVLT